MLKTDFEFKKSVHDEMLGIFEAHLKSLAFPIDSFLEDLLNSSEVYSIEKENKMIGYAAKQGDHLNFFHVGLNEFNHAPVIFEEFCKRYEIKFVQVMTQDALLSTIISEWEYKKTKDACWFIDGGRLIEPHEKVEGTLFRKASLSELALIEEKTEGFFDEDHPEKTLVKHIEKGDIFVLLDKDELLGCGIIEKSVYCRGYVSIGMVTIRDKRRKGVGQTILWNLKEWAYENNLKPIAGCWYYNVLSRRTLERAGMIAASRGFIAELFEKEALPLRTGNPPGELIQESYQVIQ